MKFTAILLAVASAVPPMVLSQDKGAASNATSTSASISAKLQVTREVKTPIAGGFAGRAKCDDDGNIYFRPTDLYPSGKYHPVSALPVQRLKPNGSLAGSFSIADTSPGLLAIDFFVTAAGKVYQAARSDANRSAYVVAYSPDGSIESKVKLATDFFYPYRIVVFRSGEFLVSGLHGAYNRTPYTAVFDANGKLIKEIYEPEDEDARKRAEAGGAGFRPENMESSNDFVTHGDAVLGSDGNAYLLRASAPALVYVISSRGEIVRKLHVDYPSAGLWAGMLKSADGMLAISFLEPSRNTGAIEVIDYRGNSIAMYTPNDNRMYPGSLTCYSANKFTFLGLESGDNIRIETVEPK